MATITDRDTLIARTRDLLSARTGGDEAIEHGIVADIVDDAVSAFSLDLPQHLTHTFDGDGSTYQLALADFTVAWVADFSVIDGPLEVVPDTASQSLNYLDANEWRLYPTGGTPTHVHLLGPIPSATESLRVLYTAPHTVSETECTVPTIYRPALAQRCACFAARVKASQASESVGRSFEAQSVDYADKAEKWLAIAGEYCDASKAMLGLSSGDEGTGATNKPAGGRIDYDPLIKGRGPVWRTGKQR